MAMPPRAVSTVVPAREEKVLLVICGANLNPASLEP